MMMTLAVLLVSEPSEVFLITLTLVGGTFLGWKLLVPLVQALAKRLEGKSATAADPEEIADLRARVQQLEAEHGRVLELEERVDFAERLLAKQRDTARLGSGEEGR